MQNKIFSANKTLNIRGSLMDLSKPKVMGILNVTPDSFYDGFRYTDEASILRQSEKMINEGADFIDVGGYSTRSGAEDISIDEERKRVLPAIEAIVKNFPEAILSVDTFRSAVAREAIQAGACLVNDVSGGELDPEMYSLISTLNVPYVMMHMRGTPQTMNRMTDYENPVKEMADYFHRKIFELQELGVKDIIIDPGFGFAKTAQQSFLLLSQLDYFKIFERPIMVGLSRKSMIWKTLKINPDDALDGTTALNTIALLKGASILRVHDVREAREVLELVQQLDFDK
ncbi:MAG: dihydropteroate synthase [Bacteroidetes bacterium]|nr:dihydropteroate synthase [Bacteroidota bacterium]